MADVPKALAQLVAEVKRRRVDRAAVAYLMVSFVLWQVAEIAVPALRLPEVVLTIIVVASIVLFPVALVAAWLYDLRLHRDDENDQGIGWTAPAGWGLRNVLVVGSAVLVLVIAASVASRWTDPGTRADERGGTRVAVFPLSTVALDDASSYGEGIAELLNLGLDGIPGLDVLDPAAFWQPVLTAGMSASLRGDADRYLETSRRFGVDRFLTGTVVLAGAALDVSVRVHDGRSGEELSSVRVSSPADSLSVLVDELIVALAAELWDSEAAPEVASITRFATAVPLALQSYLEAMRLHRRGDFAGAEREIEVAIAADSTFALAHLAHFRIRSWRLQMAGDRMVGLQEIVARADRHKDRLTPRDRLHVAAAVALNRTDGITAVDQLERILEMDPDDVAARTLHAFTVATYGWQFDRDRDDARAAFERALTLDSASLPLLELRTGIAVRDRDFETADDLVRRMEIIDEDNALSVGSRTTLEIVRASDEALDSVLQARFDESLTVAIHVGRRTRAVAPARAIRWNRLLMEEGSGVRLGAVGRGGRLQITMAAGALTAVDSLLEGLPASVELRQAMLRSFIGADLIGVGRRARGERAAEELAEAVPADSVVAYMDTRHEVWAAAWAVGAWHAAYGDPAIASAYRAGIDANPREGIPPEWPGALVADIDARLARRNGDIEAALASARRAYELWTIHDPIAGEWYPEPAIRFHLAELLDESGEAERAAALYQSFVHFTWVGYYTPLAAYRLGLHREATGDVEAARFAYRQAVELWSLGDADVVGELLNEVRRRLQSL